MENTPLPPHFLIMEWGGGGYFRIRKLQVECWENDDRGGILQSLEAALNPIQRNERRKIHRKNVVS